MNPITTYNIFVLKFFLKVFFYLKFLGQFPLCSPKTSFSHFLLRNCYFCHISKSLSHSAAHFFHAAHFPETKCGKQKVKTNCSLRRGILPRTLASSQPNPEHRSWFSCILISTLWNCEEASLEMMSQFFFLS